MIKTLIGTMVMAVALWAQPEQAPPSTQGIWQTQSSGSYLGVGVVEVNQEIASRLGLSEPHGVEVASVARRSPAQDAGLQKGDVITTYRGERVEGVEHFARLVRETRAGRNVAMTVYSDSGERQVEAAVAERTVKRRSSTWFDCEGENCGVRIPAIRLKDFDFDIPRPHMSVRNRMLGAQLEEIDGQLAEYFGVEKGVLVRSVEEGSPAGKAGLKAGDVIVSVGGVEIQRTGAVRRALAKADSEEIEIAVHRNKSRQTLTVKIEGRGAWQKPPAGVRRVGEVGDR